MRLIYRLMLDALAVLVLVGYGWTIRYTNRGAADPVWTALQARGELRVGIDPGFQPFAEERDGQLQGYDIDLAREIARRLGLRVTFVRVGYDALYDALGTQQVDLLAAALPLAPEQGWRARFTTAYLNAGQVLVVQNDSSIQNETHLAGRRLGAALGTEGDTFARKLRRDRPDIAVRSDFETTSAALDALAAGELDAVITDAVSALSALPTHNNLAIAPNALTFDPYVLAVPAEAYLLQQEVNRVLDEMRRDGFFDQLNNRWFR